MNSNSAMSLFLTVPNDGLHFWNGNVFDLKKVREFVNLDTPDIARMTGVSKASIRYDHRVPDEVREHMEAIAIICNLVYQFFKDEVKTKLWLQTPNPMLGNSSPRDMIRVGRYKKLHKFVSDALEDNVTDETTISASQEEQKIA